MNILVVDDEEGMQNILKETLSVEGHLTVLACDAQDTLNKLHDHRIDFIIMDLHMPYINGKEIIDMIHMANPKIPIIVLSGYIESADELLELGASRVLPKPFDKVKLLTTIEEILQENKGFIQKIFDKFKKK